MLLIPAIDILNGECVRLKKGEFDKNVTVYNKNPVDQAAQWAALGAERIHIVDLDGARSAQPVNADLIAQMVRTIGAAAKIEVGGGIRSMHQIEKYLEVGVEYLVIGTAAVTVPEFVPEACREFPGHIVVALDAKGDEVVQAGWEKGTGQTVLELGRRFADDGVSAFLYTDVSRDGMLSGVNVSSTAQLARESGIPVIASGGMHNLDDVRALLAVEKDGVMGAVLGKSLYEGTIDFSEAQRLVKGA